MKYFYGFLWSFWSLTAPILIHFYYIEKSDQDVRRKVTFIFTEEKKTLGLERQAGE